MAKIEWSSPPYRGLTYRYRHTKEAVATLTTDKDTPATHHGEGDVQAKGIGKYQSLVIGHVSKYGFQVRPEGTETEPWKAILDLCMNPSGLLNVERGSASITVSAWCSIIRLSDNSLVWKERVQDREKLSTMKQRFISVSLSDQKQEVKELRAGEHEVYLTTHVGMEAFTYKNAKRLSSAIASFIMNDPRSTNLEITLV